MSEDEVNPNGKVIDLVLPVAVLIVSAIGAMIYTGFLGGAEDIITAFSGCDAETSLIFAWSLKGMGDALGLADFVGHVVGDNASASIFIPAVLFAAAVFLSFSTGTSWGTFAILVPIATAMFSGGADMQMMVISVSAVLAGAVCGDHVSPISDTTVMSSAGAQSNHINHVSTQMQYAAIVTVISFAGYIFAGFVHVWWIVLGISLIVLLAVLTGMKTYLGRKQERTDG